MLKRDTGTALPHIIPFMTAMCSACCTMGSIVLCLKYAKFDIKRFFKENEPILNVHIVLFCLVIFLNLLNDFLRYFTFLFFLMMLDVEKIEKVY
jgi:hypothetical protein